MRTKTEIEKDKKDYKEKLAYITKIEKDKKYYKEKLAYITKELNEYNTKMKAHEIRERKFKRKTCFKCGSRNIEKGSIKNSKLVYIKCHKCGFRREI